MITEKGLKDIFDGIYRINDLSLHQLSLVCYEFSARNELTPLTPFWHPGFCFAEPGTPPSRKERERGGAQI